jgi:hypothetical protein
MSNPLSPGVSVKGKFITSRTLPGNTGFRTGVQIPPSRPAAKQGNVVTGSDFSADAPNESPGGNSGDYRTQPRAGNFGRFKRLSGKASGFGAVRRPAPPAGRSPMGVFPGAAHKGNFGKV